MVPSGTIRAGPFSRMNSPLRVAVIGASGYTGEELLRICLRHPRITLTAVTSRQYAGQSVAAYLGLPPARTPLVFQNLGPAEVLDTADIFFLSLPHGVAAEYAVPLMGAGKTVFDLSADFRLKDPQAYRDFYKMEHPAPALLQQAVYGLPEFHGPELASARLVACPGCYPTSIQLPLVPLLREGLIDPSTLIIHSLSGVSGAGKKAEVSYLYCECNENLRAYGIPRHRHIPEIEQELSLAAGHPVTVTFVPHLVPVTRGMLSTITASFRGRSADEARQVWERAYAGNPFVRILHGADLPEARRVAGSNRAEIAIQLDERTGRVIVLSVIDNLGKGAAGQAVQAFNIRHGFPQEEGLDS